MANNSAIASMGYGLPAAIGTCIGGGRRQTICLEGDGSIMMNLQELQTILTNHLPVKIFLINNNGYHSIRLTQNNLFKEHCKVGIGPESGDLSFPEFEKIARAFGYPYYSAHSNAEMKKLLMRFWNWMARYSAKSLPIRSRCGNLRVAPSVCRTARWSALRLRIWLRSCRVRS